MSDTANGNVGNTRREMVDASWSGNSMGYLLGIKHALALPEGEDPDLRPTGAFSTFY